MHALRCALASTADGTEALAAQILVGAGSGGIQQLVKLDDDDADFYWLRTMAAFSYLRQMDLQSHDAAHDANSNGRDQAGQLLAQLRISKSMDEAHDTAQQLLLLRIAKHISLPASDMSADKPIHVYGVDSLVAVELRNWLSLELKSDMTIFDLTGSDPISEVSQRIARRSKLVPAAVRDALPNGSL